MLPPSACPHDNRAYCWLSNLPTYTGYFVRLPISAATCAFAFAFPSSSMSSEECLVCAMMRLMHLAPYLHADTLLCKVLFSFHFSLSLRRAKPANVFAFFSRQNDTKWKDNRVQVHLLGSLSFLARHCHPRVARHSLEDIIITANGGLQI